MIAKVGVATAMISAAAALHGCAGIGPASLRAGRGAYNEVINATEDEQLLAMVVHRRYDESFGMLSVASVTASFRVSATAGGEIGVGPQSNYDGNLVPLSVSGGYEENPTISYVPLKGEQFIERMLAPITAEHAMLLTRMSTDQVESLRFLVRRVNGIVNPIYASARVALADGGAFDRFVELFVHLRENGWLTITNAPGGSHTMLLHSYGDDGAAEVDDLLRMLGLPGSAKGAPSIEVPIHFFVGGKPGEGVTLETPSAIDALGAFAQGVRVPEPHLTEGFARALPPLPDPALVDIRSSRDQPRQAAVAVNLKGWWYYIDARDNASKQAFVMLRTLIGMRIDDASAQQAAPVLTVPVSR